MKQDALDKELYAMFEREVKECQHRLGYTAEEARLRTTGVWFIRQQRFLAMLDRADAARCP